MDLKGKANIGRDREHHEQASVLPFPVGTVVCESLFMQSV